MSEHQGRPPLPTRQRLIGGAIDLVASGGVEALTLRGLGEHCGLSRGAPYRHFTDKDALVRAIAADGFQGLTRRMQRAARRGDSPLRSAMRAYVDWALANPAWYALTFQSRAATPASGMTDPDLSAAALGLLDFVTELVLDSQKTGALPRGAPGPLVGVLWAALHGAVDLAQAGHAKKELGISAPREMVDHLIQLMAGAATR